MADWVSIAENIQWPNIRSPAFLDNSRLAGPVYFQDQVQGITVAQTQDARAMANINRDVNPKDRYYDNMDGKREALQRSVLWPSDSLERKSYMPFLAAAAAVMMSPVVMPDATYTGGLVAGYFVGLAANYSQLSVSAITKKAAPQLNSEVKKKKDD